MQDNIVQFEPLEVKFLKQAISILNNLKNPSNSTKLNNLYLDTLEKLIFNYLDILPNYFVELLNIFYNILNIEDFKDINNEFLIERAILLCELLCETPSAELYIELAFNEFETLYQYTSFNEDDLLDIIKCLVCIQTNQVIPRELSSFKKFNFQGDHVRLLWLGFSKLPTTEKVQIAAITSEILRPEDFIQFSQDIQHSVCGNENVLLALISRTENQVFSKNKKRNNQIKFEIYSFIILCAIPTENVIKKIIEVISPPEKDYYNFFYMIMHEWPKNKIIYSTIQKKLDIDEHNNLDIPEPYIRRLRLIAYNI